MKLKSDRKNYVIIALCAILLVMSIGYAAFSSLLTINGTASLSDSFCVGFDNTKTNTYAPTAGITNGTLPTGSMSYSGTACSTKYQPNSSLSATFKQPGDKIEYTLTIANKSTFTVAIESILVENQNVTSNTTITKGNIKYIVEMPLTTTLASNAETTMKITAMFQNDTAVTGQYSGESQTLNVKINAEQGDSGFTPTPATQTVYAYHTDTKTIGTSAITDGVSDYTDLLTNHPTYFFKYEIDGSNIIQKAWVCNYTIFNPDIICFQGYKDTSTNQTYFNDNVSVATAFNSTAPSNASCEIHTDNVICNKQNEYVWILTYDDGRADAHGMGGSYGCFITAEGSTYCH